MKPEAKFCPTCGLAVDLDQRLAQREMELHQARAALRDQTRNVETANTLLAEAEARATAAESDLARYGAIDDLPSLQERDRRICWYTTCENCANLLDRSYAETMRAEKAEAALEKSYKSVLYIRCMAHREVPQYNDNVCNESECAVCAVQAETAQIHEATGYAESNLHDSEDRERHYERENRNLEAQLAQARAALERIYTARSYENGHLSEGISVALIAAINEAAALMGITGPCRLPRNHGITNAIDE